MTADPDPMFYINPMIRNRRVTPKNTCRTFKRAGKPTTDLGSFATDIKAVSIDSTWHYYLGFFKSEIRCLLAFFIPGSSPFVCSSIIIVVLPILF